MDDGRISTRPGPGPRRQTIPRKPVGIERHDTLNAPSGYAFDTRNHVEDDEDSRSTVSRLSTQSSGGFLGGGFISTFSPDTGYLGNDITDQGIPLMEITPATPRNGSAGKDDITRTNVDSVYDPYPQDPLFFDQPYEDCKWLPKALRWPFMTVLLMVSFGLGVLVLGLTIQSAKHSGLGSDQNTSIFLFGWRFTPTLLAVIYTLLLSGTVNDIRRTEVYARLSRPQGASALSSLFYKPRVFWFGPFDSFSKRKNNGLRNWALFWASIVYILGLLIISPFSAALLGPADVLITRDATFSRLATSVASPMQLSTDDSVFFRTISSVILNTTTSAWLSNNYTVVPFWPSTMNTVPSGSALSTNEEEWTANTTVYQTSLQCNVMNLQQFSNYSLTYNVTHTDNTTAIIYTNLTSFRLEASDGCSLGLASLTPTKDTVTGILSNGGGAWTPPPNYTYPLLWGVSNGSASDFGPNNAVAINSSTQCGDRSIFFLAAPQSVQPYQAKGYVCSSSYYSANIPVTVSNTGSSSFFKFDEKTYNRTKTPLSASVLNMTGFEETFLSQNWSTKLQPPDASGNPVMTVRPGVGGPLILVGAQNAFDMTAMIANPNLVDQARQVKQRLLGESMQPVFESIGTQAAETVHGQRGVNEERIVVSLVIGTLLTTVLFLSTVMIGLVMWYTRLRRRPLNLYQSPASTAAAASFIRSEPGTRAVFEGLDRESEDVMLKKLDGYVFSLRGGVLYSYHIKDNFQESEFESNTIITSLSSTKDWRPSVLRSRLLTPLLLLLIALTITLSILYSKYHTSGIYQSFLVSSVSIRIGNRSLEALAPYSIIPTLIAVGVKLWWSSLDETFRRLQPYVSMADGKGKGEGERMGMVRMSYVSSPLLWAAGKAARYRHWVLLIIALGAFLSEIFTVSMSALWDRNPGYRTHNITLARTVEFRSVPAIFEVPPPSAHGYENSVDTQNAKGALTNVYGNLLTSWLYASINEGAYNTTLSPWMSSNSSWAFLPATLPSLPNTSVSQSFSSPSAPISGPSTNLTFSTSAIRGRLECTPLDTSNTSAWLYTLDFTNKTAWNFSNIPADLKTGYELKAGVSLNQSLGNGKYKYWDDSAPYFSFFATPYRLKCCGDIEDGMVKEASIGYWSPPADNPHQGVVVKWITGHPFAVQFNDSTSSINRTPGEGYGAHIHWVWKDVPKLTAVNCTPIFEMADASVTVDGGSGVVQNYTITDTPRLEPNAWAYNYVGLNTSVGVPYNITAWTGSGYQVKPGQYVNNMTVSYGYLFHDALLGASNSALTGNDPMSTTVTAENLNDRTFNFRLPGLNVDFPSYVSHSLTSFNSTLLHDSATLSDISSDVFGLFFRHFVHADMGDGASGGGDDGGDEGAGVTGKGKASAGAAGMYMNGSWLLQPLGDVLPWDLGPTTTFPPVKLQANSTPQDTSPMVQAVMSTRVAQLDLSPVAVGLCLGILGFLLLATGLVLLRGVVARTWRGRREGKEGREKGWGVLPRDVDTLGSVLGFVYASERLLAYSGKRKGLKKGDADEGEDGNGEVVKMGWFEAQGQRRWGIEIQDAGPGMFKPGKRKVPKAVKPPKPPKEPKPPKSAKPPKPPKAATNLKPPRQPREPNKSWLSSLNLSSLNPFSPQKQKQPRAGEVERVPAGSFPMPGMARGGGGGAYEQVYSDGDVAGNEYAGVRGNVYGGPGTGWQAGEWVFRPQRAERWA